MITSTSNPRIKALIQLRKRPARARSGLFLIEGTRELRRALEAKVELTEAYVSHELLDGAATRLLEQLNAAAPEPIAIAPHVLERVSFRRNPTGIVAVGRQFDTALDELSIRTQTPLVLVVEAIEKPGNLGGMLRTAAAAGVDAVIACDPVTDFFNPNVVRSSMGAVFAVPIVATQSEDARKWLESRNFNIWGASPTAPTPYWEADLAGATAIVIGSEHAGLSSAWANTFLLQIPMPGSAESINAAIAAGITLFEAVRQRAAARGDARFGVRE